MSPSQRSILVCFCLAAITALIYWPVRMCDFVNFDDPAYIVSNYHITHGISWDALRWCFQAGYVSNWHPLTWMSHMLDCQLYGLRPGGHHLTNLLLHIADSVLVFLVLQQLTGTFWRSAMVAALFAWHPLHVESVAWVSERKDVLSALFWMLAIEAYAKYAAKGGVPRYLLVLALFALGLMAKPMVVTLPFVLLLLDWWPLRRFATARPARPQDAKSSPVQATSWKFLVIEKIPFFVLAAGSCILTLIAQTRAQAVVSMENVPLLVRLVNVTISYARYIDKMIWPADLTVIHPYETSFNAPGVIFSVVLLITVSLAAAGWRKSRPYLGVGWLWYLGTLVPVIGFVQVGGQAWADRYTYLPSIGFFMMVCWGAYDLTRHLRLQKSVIAITAAGALIGCGLATRAQLQYWKDGGTLFLRALQVAPDNFIAHCNYGVYLRDQNRLEEARAECETALRISPNYVYGHLFLASVLVRQGKTNEAATHLETSLEIMPDQPVTWVDLGKTRLSQQSPAAAAAAFAQAIHYAPQAPRIHALLGRALLLQGKFGPAEAEFAEALRLAPHFADADYQLGLALELEHKTSEAVAHYKSALASQADFPDALNNLAWILATSAHVELRDGAKAVELATRACALTQNTQPMMIGTLAAAYAETGRFEEAIATAQKAHDLALTQGEKSVAEKNLKLLEIYRSHQPWHEKQGNEKR